MDTRGRRRLLDQASPSLWLLYFVAGLLFANAYLWMDSGGWAPATRLTSTIGNWPRAATSPQVWAFGLVAALAIVVHYYLLVERPFSQGQRRWKAAEVARAGHEVEQAERALRDQAAAARMGIGPEPESDGRPGSAVGPAGESSSALSLLVAAYARYQLAQEQARRAKEIPVHSVRSAGDLAGKLARAGLTAVGQAVIFGKPLVSTAREAGQSAFKDVVDWFVKLVGGSG
jgi:hypothetical protein